MRKYGLTAHLMVKDEENWVWYSINSVIKYVDELLVWDTGSTDRTVEIIKSIKSQKINFVEKGWHGGEAITSYHQKMLEQTKTDWFMVLDADEIWWEDGIRRLRATIDKKRTSIWGIINRFRNCVGDVYHYQEEEAGRYKIAGYKGHVTVRAINTAIPGLHASGTFRQLGYRDGSGTLVQNLDPKNLLFLDVYYLHMTYLPRSSGDSEIIYPQKRKRQVELGIPFPSDFYYPEVFFRPRPNIVPSPWVKMDFGFFARASLETPLKKLKRRVGV